MKSAPSVLLVDDDPAVGMVLSALLRQAGIAAREVSSAEKALEALEAEPFELVVTDLRMPGMDGMRLLSAVAERWPDQQVIVLTAHGSVPLAVEAMRLGATDFLLKPFDAEEVLFVIRKALAKGEHLERAAPSPAAGAKSPRASSDPMREVQAMIDRVAPSHATVLILGESGTGKELVARALHEQSRRKGPFIKVHCAALPETLLESELFGYEKGAFTGAAARKPGRVELAQEGTIFLDEIGEIPLPIQVKLLRLLQEREFERLGGTQTLKVDVRFVAATHRDLGAMVDTGEFREDLFYRLSVVPIQLPALRDRADDIRGLAEEFCADIGRANGKPGMALEPGAVELLMVQKWPGNVRQLQNFVERLVVLSDSSSIQRADVEHELVREAKLRSGPVASGATVRSGEAGGRAQKDAERLALVQALEKARDNRTLAARLLGVSRRTLYNRLREHGLG
ncbi:MAG TPA: sigma-54 dependent transcriptional regulator [Polyangiaceae bacterium]|jgi:DNA-binding NtrC family response regulator